MTDKPTWEPITQEMNEILSTVTDRLAVPGGWIYRVIVAMKTDDGRMMSSSTSFVPFARYMPDMLTPRPAAPTSLREAGES